jgi:hypothetical protein
LDGSPTLPGMSLVRWDNGMVIPMFNSEIEQLPSVKDHLHLPSGWIRHQ